MSSLSIITQAIIDLLANDVSLGLSKVYYGETTGIPQVPSATVEVESANREYNQTGMQTNRTMNVSIVVYHGKVADTQGIKKDLDNFAQAIEDKLHEDNTLGGLVISGIVTAIEPGIAAAGNSQFFAHKLTWEGKIRERIGV